LRRHRKKAVQSCLDPLHASRHIIKTADVSEREAISRNLRLLLVAERRPRNHINRNTDRLRTSPLKNLFNANNVNLSDRPRPSVLPPCFGYPHTASTSLFRPVRSRFLLFDSSYRFFRFALFLPVYGEAILTGNSSLYTDLVKSQSWRCVPETRPKNK